MPEAAQAKWSFWRRRQSHASDLPQQFDEVLHTVAAFVDPVLGATAPVATSRWHFTERAWVMETRKAHDHHPA